jgi:type VII secretion protein EccB
MARQPNTKLHVSGYRFLLRRMEHALVRGDVRMLDDPLRAQSLSLIAGCVLAVIAIAGCAIVAFVRPQGALGGAPIVMARESGALYVRIDETMHPVLNLASARLIAGNPANPELVSDSAINGAKRGPLVGIPGAPAAIASPLDADESGWTVCDHATTTTVIAGEARGRLSPGRSVLVAVQSESAATTYLLYGGWRARVDLRNHAVVRALRLDGVAPRPVSRVVLDALPEAPQIAAPHIPGAGAASASRGFTVGTVVRVVRAGATEYYVVLADGVQRIGEVAADLIRFTNAQRGRDIVTVAPDVIGTLPAVDDLPVTTFPERAGVTDDAVLCAQWRSGAPGGGANTVLLVGDSLPLEGSLPVNLAQADGDGPDVDSVYIPLGRSAYVRATDAAAGGGTGALYVITDSGVVFGVHDDDAARRLGLSVAPVPGPWPVLARLPRGPELSVQAASVVRDSVGAAP